MRRLASTVTPLADHVGAAVEHGGQLGQPFVEELVGDAQRPDGVDEGGVGDPDGRQPEALLGLVRRGAGELDELAGDDLGRQLVQLVDDPDGSRDVRDPEAAVEALDELAVVDLERQRRQGQRPERLDHHPHDLDVVVEAEGVAPDDVDVGLGELAVAALLGPLAPPGRLDLVAPERELQLAGVLQDVAGEGHGQVEVQAQARVRVALGGLEAAQGVDLLVDLPALGEAVERFDDARLDVGEAVQLEGPREGGDHLALDDALGRQQLGEPAQRGDLGDHVCQRPRVTRPAEPSVRSSRRNGLVARSRPMDVCSP